METISSKELSSGAVYKIYRNKKAAVEEQLSRAMRRNNWFVFWRPLVFLAAVAFALAYSFLAAKTVYLVGSALLLAAFILLIVGHNRLKAYISYLERLVQINQLALRRLDGDWPDFAGRGERFIDPAHRYAVDLNIFGRGSLFQYVNATTSVVGEERLARMLCTRPGLEEILLRQQAIRELGPRLDWRQHFQAVGLQDSLDRPESLAQLLAWAGEKPVFAGKYVPLLLWLPLLTAGLAVGGYLHWPPFIPPYLWLPALGLQVLVVALTARTAHRAFVQTAGAAAEIQRCAGLLSCIEKENFTSPLLQDLKNKLVTSGAPPSREIRKLSGIVDRMYMRYSSLHPVVSIALLWDLHTLLKLEKWRAGAGHWLRGWIEVLAEFEALCSLAGLAHDHPRWTMPQLQGSVPALKAVALGHPLIHEAVRVPNDVELPGPGSVLIITGSNMSGKSTLLRTVGVNLVLAYAGAPVCAERFTCSLMDIYSSIHINDNLEQNISTFYAELQRIKVIVDAARSGKPVIFLIDEIFKGTNSKDRILGARSVIKGLSGLCAIGLVSTHDLELSRLEDESALIKNYHFTDQISGQEISFDYLLKPGVSRSTNAVALMKIIGLEIT